MVFYEASIVTDNGGNHRLAMKCSDVDRATRGVRMFAIWVCSLRPLFASCVLALSLIGSAAAQTLERVRPTPRDVAPERTVGQPDLMQGPSPNTSPSVDSNPSSLMLAPFREGQLTAFVQRASTSETHQAWPELRFIGRPSWTRDEHEITVWAAVRVTPPEAALSLFGRRVVLQVRSPAVLSAGESTIHADGIARVSTALPVSTGGMVSVIAYLRDEPAISTGERKLRPWNRVAVDFELGLTVLSPGLPSAIDKLFSEEPQPLEVVLLLTARPKLSATLWNDGRTEVAGFIEQPFIAASSAVVPTPGLAFPATADGRWGLGDPETGVSLRWHDIFSAVVAFNGRHGRPSIDTLHRLGTPGALSISDGFKSLDVRAGVEYGLGRVLLVGSIASSNPLRQRMDEGSVARAGPTLQVSGGIGKSGGARRSRAVLWLASARYGGIDIEHAATSRIDSVVPLATDRLMGVTVQKQRNHRVEFSGTFLVGGLGARTYVGGGLTVNTTF